MCSAGRIRPAGRRLPTPGLVVRAEGSHPRSWGSNPAVYWMDLSDASYYKFNERRNKGSQMGHTKKSFLKKVSLQIQKILQFIFMKIVEYFFSFFKLTPYSKPYRNNGSNLM
jgi:hypothetical protein